MMRRIIAIESVILVAVVALVVVRAITQGAGASQVDGCGQAGVFQREDNQVVLCDARPQLYKYDTKLLGLMSPAFDPSGKLWVGAMATNSLMEFDPTTGSSHNWPVPNGKHLLMETAVDTRGNVWFAEQGAGYIGRLDPTSHVFTQFAVRGADGQSAGAQALWFDRAGNLWFTVPVGGWIGKLDPATGHVRAYHVPARSPGAAAVPYDLALAPDGHVWFGYLDGGAIGELDPTSGDVTLHPLQNPDAHVYAIAPDAQGRIWFTEFTAPRIGYIVAGTGAVHEIEVPATLGKPDILYGITVGPDGAVWFGSFGASSLVRYSPDTHQFVFFRLHIGKNTPYELTFDFAGHLWFTSQGDTPSYLGALIP